MERLFQAKGPFHNAPSSVTQAGITLCGSADGEDAVGTHLPILHSLFIYGTRDELVYVEFREGDEARGVVVQAHGEAGTLDGASSVATALTVW